MLLPKIKILSLALLLLLTGPAWSDAPENTTVHVMGPFARAVPKVMKNAAAYMSLHNMGKTERTLMGFRGDVAEHIELHQSLMADGMMKMQYVGKLAIPPGTMVEFKPGGYHIMLMGLKHPLKEGQSFHLTLIYDDGSERHIMVPVQPMDAQPMQMHQHDNTGSHEQMHESDQHKKMQQSG